jgi:hypothetical protein
MVTGHQRGNNAQTNQEQIDMEYDDLDFEDNADYEYDEHVASLQRGVFHPLASCGLPVPTSVGLWDSGAEQFTYTRIDGGKGTYWTTTVKMEGREDLILVMGYKGIIGEVRLG